jgi:hypothetical protein
MNKVDLKFKNTCDLYLNEGIIGGLHRSGLYNKGKEISKKIDRFHAATTGKDAGFGALIGALEPKTLKELGIIRAPARKGDDRIFYKSIDKHPPDIYTILDDENGKDKVHICRNCNHTNPDWKPVTNKNVIHQILKDYNSSRKANLPTTMPLSGTP